MTNTDKNEKCKLIRMKQTTQKVKINKIELKCIKKRTDMGGIN